jgi:ABC-2 type transport system ATP-binding protein
MTHKSIAISVKNLHKNFKLPHERQNSLKGRVINFRKRSYNIQHALKDISFDIEKGEFFGIVGRNGSGKSTLLKLLAGIYTPNSGSIEVDGKLTPFIELGVGFNPELTGRDNVFLNGALLGFNRDEMNAMYSDIVDFAELDSFMDQKLKNYSSGMQVRLAFSIAIRASTDILVLDEVLAVGDEAFQRKCYDYFNKLKEEKKTVVLVSHDMGAIKRFCTRVAVVDRAELKFIGDTDSAAEIYRNLNLDSTEDASNKTNKKRKLQTEDINGGCKIVEIRTTDEKTGNLKTLFKPKEKIIIEALLKVAKDTHSLQLNISFNNPGGVPLTALSQVITSVDDNSIAGQTIRVLWPIDGVYNDGKYLISLQVSNPDTHKVYSRAIDGSEFNIVGWDDIEYIFHTNNKATVMSVK